MEAKPGPPHAVMPVLDLRTVGQLRALPGRTGSLFDDLVPAFLSSSRMQVTGIHGHLATGDVAAAAGLAHQLAGACGSFGASRMAAAGLALSYLLHAETALADRGEAMGHLSRLEAELHLVEDHLATLPALTAASAR